jgi:ABC-type multidrug transport system fused ATPase/permease subunit
MFLVNSSSLTISKHLQRLWRHVSHHHRRNFGLLLILTLLTSFAEMIGIGSVIPFLAAITAPERLFELSISQPIIIFLGISEAGELLLPITIFFGVTTIIAGAMRLLLLWASTRLSFAAGADLSIDIYRRTLYQPYAVHCGRNSSEVINGISGKANGVIYNIIVPVLTIINSSIMLVVILIALFMVEPVITFIAFFGFGLIYVSIILLTQKQLLIDSNHVARESNNVIKCLQEGLGGIRDVLINSSQETFCQIYRNSDLKLRRSQGNTLFIAFGPRYAMEALGMLLIVALAYFMANKPDGILKAIPILGALALGAQRLLPILQQAYASWATIKGAQKSLEDTLDLLDQPLPNNANQSHTKPLAYKNNICLSQLSFRYNPETAYVLKTLDLTILKGSRIGFIGVTGSGKSTLLDILMGLLEPTRGSLEVDGQQINKENHSAWQARIAHVPQSIFLSDTTIEENIAFGVNKAQIDKNRVKQAARKAQISDTIELLPAQYQTIVGERGVRLSGGQRQRIGIARALYKKADVIIFDEATSALDTETEQLVMQAIEDLSTDLTILIIAHRLSTLKNTTKIFELADGRINKVGSYQEFVKNLKNHSN